MKKIKIAFIILAIFAFVSFMAYNDYKWADGAIRAYAAEGWDVVAATSDNYVDIAAPWSIIKTPISRIALLQSNNIVQLGQQYMIADVLWVDNAPSRTAEIFRDVYDCQNNKSAYIETTVDINTLDITSLKWSGFSEDMPGFQVIKKVCEFKK